MHNVKLCGILDVLAAPLWKNLLTKHVDEVDEVLVAGEFDVLLSMLKAELDSIEDWATH